MTFNSGVIYRTQITGDLKFKLKTVGEKLILQYGR